MIDYYTKRSNDMEYWCLADFISKCQYSKTTRKINFNPDDNNDDNSDSNDDNCNNENNIDNAKKKYLKLKNNFGYIHIRRIQKIIRYRNYSIIEDELNFYREQLMLFSNWRDENEITCLQNVKYIYDLKFNEIKGNRKNYIFNDNIESEMDDALQDIQFDIDNEPEEINNDNNETVKNLAIYELNVPNADIGLEIPDKFTNIDIVQNVSVPR